MSVNNISVKYTKNPIETVTFEIPNNEGIKGVAQNRIKPTGLTRAKNAITEKWHIAKEYPQAGINKIKAVFTKIYNHPSVPFIGAGLFGASIASVIGLSIPVGFVFGAAGIGLEYLLEAIAKVAKKAFNWIQGTKPQSEKTSECYWKQTLKTVPIAVVSFSLGLNSHHLILAAKIAASAVIIGAGAFALGATVRG
ncbi:MAG: hypothetical protein ACRCU0_01645 [Candidatus Rhabdochlamydia sp.]